MRIENYKLTGDRLNYKTCYWVIISSFQIIAIQSDIIWQCNFIKLLMSIN